MHWYRWYMVDFISIFPVMVSLVAILLAFVGRIWMRKETLSNTWHFLFLAILLTMVSLTKSDETFHIIAFYILAISLTYELLLLLQQLISSLQSANEYLDKSDALAKILKKTNMLLSSELAETIENLNQTKNTILQFEETKSEQRLQYIEQQLVDMQQNLTKYSRLAENFGEMLTFSIQQFMVLEADIPHCAQYRQHLEVMLQNMQCNKINDVGCPYNAARHQNVEWVESQLQSQANIVVRSLRVGLEIQGEVLQKALVSVYKYVEPQKTVVSDAEHKEEVVISNDVSSPVTDDEYNEPGEQKAESPDFINNAVDTEEQGSDVSK